MLKKTAVVLMGVLLLIATGFLLVKKHSEPASSEPASSEPASVPVPVVEANQELTSMQPAPSDNGLAPPPLPPVDESIKTMLESSSYKQRIQTAVYDLPETLGGKEASAVEAYLKTPQDGKDGDFRQQEYALRNYMMDALRANTDRLSETISTFVDVASDNRQGDVMRGYALQHLCSVYIDNFRTLSGEDKREIIDTFSLFLNESSAGTVAGTALIGLHEASRADSTSVAGKAVETAALKLLQNSESGALSKISAFQICGERKTAGVAQLARKTALDTSADWVLRMSAVYALGQLGQTDGLESLLNDPDKNVSHAARVALNTQR